MIGPVHRRKKMRHPDWNYYDKGYYFVTMVLHNRLRLFGVLKNQEMHLNDFGIRVDQIWKNIFKLKPWCDAVECDEYIFMPDHMHAIIRMLPNDDSSVGLSELVQRFKSYSTREYKRWCYAHDIIPNEKLWQRSFHDRIFRPDPNSLESIRAYIRNNPIRG